MYRMSFVFADRQVITFAETFCIAVIYARHVLTFHWKTVQCVEIQGARRDNYPLLLTVKRSVRPKTATANLAVS